MTPSPKLENVLEKGFQKQLSKLVGKGGMAARVAQKVSGILGTFELELPTEVRQTKHGESRIKNCVKYDLPDAYRLVTVEQGGHRFWLFIGTHDEADHWLDAHRNIRLVLDSSKKRVTLTRVSSEEETLPLNPPPVFTPDISSPLFNVIPDDVLNSLALPVSVVRLLTSLNRENHQESADKLLEFSAQVGQDKIFALIDALDHLARNQNQEAISRLKLIFGEAKVVEEDVAALEAALDSGENQENLIRLRDLSPEEIKRWLEPSKFDEWMLFLHPDQKKLVITDFDGPARVTGVSGSGKTIILVHRARSLATDSPSERILIITLNKPLASLIERLVAKLCSHAEIQRIRVLPMYELCHEVVQEFGQDPQGIRLEDPLSGESIRTNSWEDFFQHANTQSSYSGLITHLEARASRVNASLYLREELTWIRSALGRTDRVSYLEISRIGRSIPLVKAWREQVLRLLSDWEEWMERGALLDPEGVSLLAYEHRSELSQSRHRYRHILVDEAQDLSTLELSILAGLVKEQHNGIFLVGDAAQRVYPKHSSLIKAGIPISGRAKIIRKNYRNTKQILEAANTLIQAYPPLQGEEPEGFQVLNPEYSTREGPKPVLRRFREVDDQGEWVVSEIRRVWSMSPGLPICVVTSRERTRDSLSNLLRKHAIENCRLDMDKWDAKCVLISDLERVKGFEFGVVFILDLSANIIPGAGVPEEEWWREACHLYVAMTRAREELMMSVVGNPSPFVKALEKMSIEGADSDN